MIRPSSTLLLRDVRPPWWAGVVAGAGAVAATTVLIYPLREIVPAVSTGVVYLLAVLLVATWFGLWVGLGTALASALAFNWFHIPPTGKFTISDPQNWVALIVFLVAAAIERETLQQDLVETRALRRSDDIKTALLRAVSHDLRSPLTAIATAGEALSSPSLTDEERAELAAAVTGEAQRLSRLVDKLLDLSRLQGGAADPRTDWVAVEELLRAAIEETPHGAGFNVGIDRDLPLVRADAVQLERAFANLLENAARYGGDQPVAVRARAVGQRLLIRIVDQGPGIPGRELERIFEPFYRAPERRGDGHVGSGLGLAVVRGFVEANGGRVWAESLPGQGTTFVVELPVESSPEGSDSIGRTRLAARSSGVVAPSEGA
ncbi:ATP-binding protein [Conexibacter sp. CPCC 205762]|uniref:sensor histidine kinase n=1 Tax=Conexibacter sp. CPCC 205762 TaxID=3064573 RepID=UPI00271B1DB4|nr:ATP-binding protein [Conexibacter sp. CPCC 205762]MDO8202094.1 ATP-binding protein [Conexibacter sp. CPCC 205762]